MAPINSRRDFVIGTGAALAASNLPAVNASPGKDDAAAKMLAAITEELLVDYPESATQLGIDNGARAALKSKLADRSAAGQQTIAQRVAQAARTPEVRRHCPR